MSDQNEYTPPDTETERKQKNPGYGGESGTATDSGTDQPTDTSSGNSGEADSGQPKQQ